MRRSSWLFLASSVALVGVLFVFVFPTSSWLAQRRAHAEVDAELRRVTAQNRGLEQRVQLLHTTEEIERIARAKYDLVRPGEEAFVVLPPRRAAPTATATRTADHNGARHDDDGLWERVWARAGALF